MLVRLLSAGIVISALSGGNALILGPYDVDNDSNSELLLILNKEGGPALEWVENIPEDGVKSLWSYSIPGGISGHITDAQIYDLDADGYPECIFTLLTLGLKQSGELAGLHVFRGVPGGFSDQAYSVNLENESGLKIRPTGMTIIARNGHNYIFISQGTPARKLLSFSLELSEGGLEKGDVSSLESPLLNNGYNPVYVGNISAGNRIEPIAFSAEEQEMKVALFNMDEMGGTGLAIEKTLPIPDASPGPAFGPGITSFDWDGNGMIDLLIPFFSGRVLALDYSSGDIKLVTPDIDRQFLVSGEPGAIAGEMEKIFLKEQEKRLLAEQALNLNEVFLSVENRDTVALGGELSFDAFLDTTGKFYSFQWVSRPPEGCEFDPETGIINWVPDRDQIGGHVLIYRYEERTGTEHLVSQDELGDTHKMVPVLDEKTSTFAILVVDSIREEESRTLLPDDLVRIEEVPAEMFTLTLTRPTDDPDKSYVFSGEPPFGVKARQLYTAENGEGTILSYTVSGNLAMIKPGEEALFTCSPSGREDLRYHSILTLVQDLENNLVFVSISPKTDTLPQWIDPENFNAELYRFPHFYFEGFNKDLKAFSEVGGIAFRFGNSETPERVQASIKVQFPSGMPEELILNIQEGIISEITGSVKVKENGSKKSELTFKSTEPILPLSLVARTPVGAAYMEEIEAAAIDSLPAAPPPAEERMPENQPAPEPVAEDSTEVHQTEIDTTVTHNEIHVSQPPDTTENE